MEISSRTIISWFFHLHGNVRAKASKISCASSVTFSPMLSVCVVIVKEREREREREVSVDTKRPARENGTSQKGWTFQMSEETTLSNNTFHSATAQDVHSSTIARGGTQKNARRRRSNDIEIQRRANCIRTRDKLRRFHRGFKPSLLPSFIDDW